MVSSKNRNKGSYKASHESKKESSNKKKKQKNVISGFSTLNQVAGVPLVSEHHSNIPILPVKSVQEPGSVCPMCGERIETIASAMLNENGEYVHFDCVLARLKEEENLKENQVLSYIGSGRFGVCEKNDEGKWIIVKTIQYETPEKNKAMKEYVEGLKI